MLTALTLAFLALPAFPALAAEPPPLLLAETAQAITDVSLYLVSEKLDGVRAFWDGQSLRTRNGNPIAAPAWFVEKFPPRPLDGELWIGRGQFDRLSATVRRQVPDDAEWRQVRYMLFELPHASGTFRERAQAMRQLVVEADVPWLQVVDQFEVASRKALENKLAEIVQAGGEGLMLHRADAPYLTGRHDALLKLKLWQDAEATVIAHLPGKGKYRGLLGGLRVRTPEGVEFTLGTGLSDAERRDPPPLGALVTYRYRELTHYGVPRFASYYRVREL
ncbi:DNA ligase [Propionivibrio limicola]|uniref:DNA ligase n=1 Tax=Propionivibrio limicola TaxID=167645 RepID=UPI001FE2BDAC|nr:DNA ligase [Propionivibrio limicola]